MMRGSRRRGVRFASGSSMGAEASGLAGRRAAARGVGVKHAGQAAGRDAGVKRGGPAPDATVAVGWNVWLVLGALPAALLLAPPLSNYFWALNGFRSVGVPARLGLLAVAAVLGVIARGRSDSRVRWLGIGACIAIALALGVSERVHLLGDTDLRIRAIASFDAGRFGMDLGEWARQIHAQPFDLVVNCLLPVAWVRAGHTVIQSVQLASLLQGFAFVWVIWQVSARLAPPAGARVLVCLALAMSGVLEAFAGYAESAGVVLVAGAWWWCEMLAPLDRRSRVVRLAGAWLLFLLFHRVALVLVPVMLVRGMRRHHPQDTDAARRESLVATAFAVLLGVVILAFASSGGRLGGDFADLFAVLSGWLRGRRVPALSDVLNLLVLVAPVAWVALATLRDPSRNARDTAGRGWLYGVALVSLFPMILALLTGPHELGGHRDWDTSVLFGWTLSLAAVDFILRLPAGRARAVLAAAVPVLALVAGGWVAVNANAAAVGARAEALASQPPRMEDEARSMLEVFLGDRAMNQRDAIRAAPHFERAYALAPNPRLLLLATEARARAGDFAAARVDLAKAWGSGLLNTRNQESARTLGTMIDAMEREARGGVRDSVGMN